MNDILRIISRIGLELPPPHLLWVIAGAVAVLGAATIAWNAGEHRAALGHYETLEEVAMLQTNRLEAAIGPARPEPLDAPATDDPQLLAEGGAEGAGRG